MKKHLITFLVDTSGSMYDKLESVKEALVRFQLELEDDFYYDTELEISVVTFGQDVCVLVPPTPAKEFNMPSITEWGLTCIWKGLYQTFTLIDDWKSRNRTLGYPYYKPWIILITDIEGENTGDLPDDRFEELALQRLKKKDVNIFSIGLGYDVSRDILNQISFDEIKPVIIEIEKIKEFLLIFSHEWEALLYQNLSNYTIKDRWQDTLSDYEQLLIRP